MLALGAVLAGALLLVGGRRIAAEAGGSSVGVVTAVFLALTVAGAPYTVWRVVEDIRETAPISAEHARYVGAETKLIDGELAQRIGSPIPPGGSYYVAVAPSAYSEIRESLGNWLGYALLPRRRVLDPKDAEWIVTWGATPAELGLRAGEPSLVGRNRLSEREPVYLAPAR
jgi:hypothetical protein